MKQSRMNPQPLHPIPKGQTRQSVKDEPQTFAPRSVRVELNPGESPALHIPQRIVATRNPTAAGMFGGRLLATGLCSWWTALPLSSAVRLSKLAFSLSHPNVSLLFKISLDLGPLEGSGGLSC